MPGVLSRGKRWPDPAQVAKLMVRSGVILLVSYLWLTQGSMGHLLGLSARLCTWERAVTPRRDVRPEFSRGAR